MRASGRNLRHFAEAANPEWVEPLNQAVYFHDYEASPLDESLAVLDKALCGIVAGAQQEKGMSPVLLGQLRKLANRVEAARLAHLLARPTAEVESELKSLLTGLAQLYQLCARSGRVVPGLGEVLRFLAIATQRLITACSAAQAPSSTTTS